VTSALLAQRGIRGFEEPLEGRAGFFAAFARGHYEADRLTRNLGQVFKIANISFKPWPSCRGTHAAIEAALKCREGIAAGDVDSVTIHGGPMLRMLAEPRASKIRPETAIDAKFSLPFTVATALTHGRVGLQSFQPECLADEQILGLAARVEVVADAAPGTAIGARIRIRVRGGIEREMQVLTPLGSPTHPMSRQALIDKFIECAGLAMHPLHPDAASRFAARALSLEELADIGAHLMPLLR
jgi:2-methylcitrate dehydratase PrpD